jgi:hypothetical protein
MPKRRETGPPGHVLAVHHDTAAVGHLGPREQAERRRLAAAARPSRASISPRSIASVTRSTATTPSKASPVPRAGETRSRRGSPTRAAHVLVPVAHPGGPSRVSRSQSTSATTMCAPRPPSTRAAGRRVGHGGRAAIDLGSGQKLPSSLPTKSMNARARPRDGYAHEPDRIVDDHRTASGRRNRTASPWSG